MLAYAETTTVRETLPVFFHANGFAEDGGYNDAWVKLKVGPIPVAFPNIEARRACVRGHDVHHLVTGYQLDWPGEMEIGAWEVATGCRHYWVAWILNLWAFGMGLVLHPRRTVRAFCRGRHSRNIYRDEYEMVLDERLGDLCRRLGLHHQPTPTPADWLALCLWGGLALLVTVAGLALPLALLALTLTWVW